MPHFTKKERDELDRDLLKAICEHPGQATYYYRNVLDERGTQWYRRGLATSHVLRTCRRLEKLGLIEEKRSNYLVMKEWKPTDAGRAKHAEPANVAA